MYIKILPLKSDKFQLGFTDNGYDLYFDELKMPVYPVVNADKNSFPVPLLQKDGVTTRPSVVIAIPVGVDDKETTKARSLLAELAKADGEEAKDKIRKKLYLMFTITDYPAWVEEEKALLLPKKPPQPQQG